MSSEYYSTNQTIETENYLEYEELTEQLKTNKNLKEQNEQLTSQLTNLKHESSTEIQDLNNKLSTLEKKNSSLQNYLEEIKNEKNNSLTEEAKGKSDELKDLEYKIHDLESKINLSEENKMDFERKINENFNEISLLKVENTKIKMENLKFKSKIEEIFVEKNTENEESYKNFPENVVNLLTEKDEKIQIEEIRYEKFENDCYELYSEEIAKEFLNQKKIEDENLTLTNKLREITTELEAKKKEFQDLGNFSPKKSQKRNVTQNQRISRLRESLLSSTNINIIENNNNVEDDDAMSFNSEEVQMILEKYQESERAFVNLNSQYETEKNKWEFDMQRLQNHYTDSEQSMKMRIEDLMRINDNLRKENTEIENMHNKLAKSEDESENYYLIENEELNKRIFDLEDNLSKTEYRYNEKISYLKKELLEKDEYYNALNSTKNNLSNEIDRLNIQFCKKEKEIKEKNLIEVDIKNKENIQLIEKIEIFNKEIDSKKQEIILMKNNYDKLLKNFELLNKNQGIIAANNKREFDRLNDDKEKIRILSNKEVSEKINEIYLLKEKIKELEKKNAEKIGENPLGEKTNFALDEILEEENNKNSLESELNKKEEKIANLEIELNSLNRKVKKNADIENEIAHLKNLTNTQAENLLKQKEVYEKQISELQKKALVINADLLSQKRRTTSIKSDANLNPTQMAIYAELNLSLKKLNAENKYLKEQIEIIKEELEKNKISRENDVSFFKGELLNAEKIAVEAKISLATLAFDKECEIVKFRNLCKKYKVKLASLGFGNSNSAGNANNIKKK